MKMHLFNDHKVIAAAIMLLCCSFDLARCFEQRQQQQATAAIGAANGVGQTSRGVRTYRQPYATNVAQTSCDNKALLTSLHDRVGVLASLDEDQRNRLEAIDKKLTQFETSNLGRLDSLSVQQTDFLKRLDSLEHIQRLVRHTVDELKGDTNDLATTKIKSASKLNDLSLSRAARQAPDNTADPIVIPDGLFYKPETSDDQLQTPLFNRPRNNTMQLDVSQQLEAISKLVLSTRLAVEYLTQELSSNITRLGQQQNILKRRFNNVFRTKSNKIDTLGLPQQQHNYYATVHTPQRVVTSCLEGEPTSNGILKLQLTPEAESFYVRCDDSWTVILNRKNGDVNFERDWLEYKDGFGNLAGEFFIGLEKLHALTSSTVHELRIVLEDYSGEIREAGYSSFAIASEREFYTLNLLGAFNMGSAGDALTYHAGQKFSTFDHDNDGCLECNCAVTHKGGWWYNWCATSNLMGVYSPNRTALDSGMIWRTPNDPMYSVRGAKMLIRPINNDEDNQRKRR